MSLELSLYLANLCKYTNCFLCENEFFNLCWYGPEIVLTSTMDLNKKQKVKNHGSAGCTLHSCTCQKLFKLRDLGNGLVKIGIAAILPVSQKLLAVSVVHSFVVHTPASSSWAAWIFHFSAAGILPPQKAIVGGTMSCQPETLIQLLCSSIIFYFSGDKNKNKIAPRSSDNVDPVICEVCCIFNSFFPLFFCAIF